jgi:peptidoglycan/LPS O-acetylase OafA/YrhL
LLLSAYNVLFLFGILAALWFRRLTPGAVWAALGVGTLLFVWVGMGTVYGSVSLAKEWRTLAYGVGGMGIVAGLAALDAAGRIRTPRILVVLGDASYAIYLLHIMAMTVVVRVAGRIFDLGALPVSVVAVALLVGALVVGTLVHLVIERPILRWFRARRAG